MCLDARRARIGPRAIRARLTLLFYLLASSILPLLPPSQGLRFRFRPLHRKEFLRKPIYAPPQATAQETEHEKVYAVGREEESEEKQLQGRERGVCGDEESGSRAGSEHRGPEVAEEGRAF